MATATQEAGVALKALSTTEMAALIDAIESIQRAVCRPESHPVSSIAPELSGKALTLLRLQSLTTIAKLAGAMAFDEMNARCGGDSVNVPGVAVIDVAKFGNSLN